VIIPLAEHAAPSRLLGGFDAVSFENGWVDQAAKT
jgi:hypothetical protein